MTTLAQEHDCLLLDLDGTVFRGQEPTDGRRRDAAAVDARTLYVTNNASRGPDEVAQHLVAMGFAAAADDVVTSAQSAARLLATQLPSGIKVLVVGTESLAAEVRNVGLEPVREVRRRPGRGGSGSLTADRMGRPRRGGAGDPRRRAVGGGQRRPHAALRARPAARQRVDGRGAAHRDRPANRRSRASRSRRCCTDALARGEFRRPLVVGTGSTPTSRAPTPPVCPACWCSPASARPRDMVLRRSPSERPNYLAADLRSLYDRQRHACASGRIRPGASRSARGAVTVHVDRQDAEDPLTRGARHRQRGVGLERRRTAVRDRRRRRHGARGAGALVAAGRSDRASVNAEMTYRSRPDPSQDRGAARRAARHRGPGLPTSTSTASRARLEEAHDLLVQALESVEKGPARRTPGRVST